MGATVVAVEKLKIESNPFDTGLGGGMRVGRPLQKSLGEVIRQIGLEAPVVVVSGSPGTGKTLLAKMAKRACIDMGLSVRRIDRGDFADIAAGRRCDLLLVDESDSLPDSALHMLLFEGERRPATTTVLLCLPGSVRRFSTADAVFVELTRLSQSDTRSYLQERANHAGFSDLFTPGALDLIVDASRGVPRTLWSIAGLAYFSAACAGASQISRQNVADAAASQMSRAEASETPVPAPPSVKLVTETPVRNAPAANAPRTSESVAVFPGGANLGKRGNSAEAPTPPMPRSEETSARSTSPAVSSPMGATSKQSAAELMLDLPESIAAALDPSAFARGELPVDRKARDVSPVETAPSETTAVRGRDDLFVFADDAPAVPESDGEAIAEPIADMRTAALSSTPFAEPIAEMLATPKLDTRPSVEMPAEPVKRARVPQPAAKAQSKSQETADAARIALRFAPAGVQRDDKAPRRPLLNIGAAAGVAFALAAAVLTIYVRPMFLNEKPAIATGAKNTVSAPVAVKPPSTTAANRAPSAAPPAVAAKEAVAAGQATGKGVATNKPAATRTTQRADRVNAAPAPARRVVAPPPESNAVPALPVEADAAASTLASSAEADALAAAVVARQEEVERARMAKESAAQAQAAAIRETETADRVNAAVQQARAAAQAQAARDARRRNKDAFDTNTRIHLNY